MASMKMFGSHRRGGAKLQSIVACGVEGVSRAMAALRTPALGALVYAILERLSLCDSPLSAVLLPVAVLTAVLLPLPSAGCPLWSLQDGLQFMISMAVPCPCRRLLSHTFLPTVTLHKHAKPRSTAYHIRLLRQITTIHNGFQQLVPTPSRRQHPLTLNVPCGAICRKCPTMLRRIRCWRWSRLDLSSFWPCLLLQLRAV